MREIRPWQISILAIVVIVITCTAVFEISAVIYTDESMMPVRLFYALIFGVNIACLAVALLCYSIRIYVDAGEIEVEDLRPKVCSWAKWKMGDGEIVKDGIRLQLDSKMKMNITICEKEGRRYLALRASPTLEAIGLMFFFFAVIPLGGLVSLGIAILSYDKLRTFRRVEFNAWVDFWKEKHAKAGQGPVPTTHEEVDQRLVETIARLQHLARGANNALFHAHEERTAVLALIVFLIGLGAFIQCLYSGLSSFLLLLIVGVIIAIEAITILSMRRHYRPLIEDLTAWERWLDGAMQTASYEHTSDAGSSFFSGLETLLLACRQAPKWIKMRSSNMFVRVPRATMVIVALLVVFWNIQTYLRALPPEYQILIFIPLIAALVAFIIARIRIAAEDRETLERWQGRIDSLMSKIEGSLEED